MVDVLNRLHDQQAEAKVYPPEEKLSSDDYREKIKDKMASSDDKKLIEATNQAIQTAQDFCAYIDTLKSKLVKESGGPNSSGHPVNAQNKAAVNQIMLTQREGPKLEEKIKNFITLYQEIIDQNLTHPAKDIIAFYLSTPKERKNKDWAEYNFRDMSAGMTYIMLSKYRNDAISSESKLLRALSEELRE